MINHRANRIITILCTVPLNLPCTMHGMSSSCGPGSCSTGTETTTPYYAPNQDMEQYDIPLNLTPYSHDFNDQRALFEMIIRLRRVSSVWRDMFRYRLILDISGLTIDQIEKLVNRATNNHEREQKVRGICCHNINTSAAMLPRIVTTFRCLEILDLSGCFKLSTNDFDAIAQQLTTLKSLHLSNTEVDDADLKKIITANPGIEELHLDGCSRLSTKGFVALTDPTFTKLRKLYAGRTSIDKNALQKIISSHKKLEELHLDGCTHLDTKGLSVALNLKKLNICYTKIDDGTLKTIIRANPELEELYLINCAQLSTEGLAVLGCLTSLKRIFVHGTAIGQVTLDIVRKNNPGINIFH